MLAGAPVPSPDVGSGVPGAIVPGAIVTSGVATGAGDVTDSSSVMRNARGETEHGATFKTDPAGTVGGDTLRQIKEPAKTDPRWGVDI